MHPQGLGQRVALFGFQAFDPALHRRNHVLRFAAAQFDFGPVSYAVVLAFQQFQQTCHRLAGDLRQLGRLPAFVAQSVDAAVFAVAVRVAQVVLHVADDRVLPVGNVQGSVRPHLGIYRAEVRISAQQHRLEFAAPECCSVVFDLVPEHALHTDAVRHGQRATVVFREVAAAEELHPTAGARALLVHLRGAAMFHRVRQVAAEECRVVRVGTSTVDHDVVAPLVEHVAVRVGKAVGHIDFELHGARIVAVHTAVDVPLRWAVRRFNLAVVERTFLEEHIATRPHHEAVGTVVRIGTVQPAEHALTGIGLVVAVGVLQQPDVRALGHQHATGHELKPGRVVQPVGEHRAFVGLAVAVGVFEDQDLVVERILRLPVRVAVPADHPQPASLVPRHLHRVHEQTGEGGLVGEQVHLEVLAQRHAVDGGFAAGENVFAFRPLARLVGDDLDELGGLGVVDRCGASLGDGVDVVVAEGRHLVQDLHLALGHGAVGLLLRFEHQMAASTVDAVPIGGAVALVPVEVAIHRSRVYGFHQLLVTTDRLAEELRVDHLCHLAVAVVGQVDAVDGERCFRLRIRSTRRVIEIDVGHAVRCRNFRHRLAVQGDTRVVFAAIGQVQVLQVLVGNRPDEDHLRGGSAVVLLLLAVGDEVGQLFLELGQPLFPAEAFVVAEAGDDPVGLHAGQPLVVAAEVRRAQPLVEVRLAAEAADLIG